MKRFVTVLLVAITASFSALLFAGTSIKQSELPQAAQTFLSKYFPGDNIKKAEKEQGRRGAEVDFRNNGDWKEVKAARGQAVPAEIVPEAISKFVTTNFDGLYIIEISRERGGYEIKLSNGSELKLTENAKPFTENRGGQRGNRPRR